MIDYIQDVSLTFLFLFSFSFRGKGAIDSSMAVLFILAVCAAVHKRYFYTVWHFISGLYFRNIIIMYLAINAWAAFVVLVNGSSDISFFITFFHMFLQWICGVFLYAWFTHKNREKRVIEYIMVSFIIQSLIQWAAFALPSMHAFVRLFQNENTIAIGHKYGQTRALAISGSSFFGLAVSYGLAFIIFWSDENLLCNKNRAAKQLLYILMVTGTFFAGRTGYVGLALGLMCLAFKRKRRRRLTKGEFAAGLAGIFCLVGGIVWFVRASQFSQKLYTLFRITFEVFINRITKGTFRTTSTDTLWGMYFKIPFETFIAGDGMYTNADGSYYMSTDSGYMRQILFIGVIGLFLLIVMQFFIIGWGKHDRAVRFFAFIYILVAEIKGETASWGLILQGILILYSMRLHMRMETVNIAVGRRKIGVGVNYTALENTGIDRF